MTAAELNVVISATDNASGVIAGVASQLAGLEGASASAGTAVASTALRWQQSGRRIKEVGESIDTITKPLQYAAVGIAGLGVASGKTAISFEDNFARVKKTVEGTPEQLEAVKQGLIDLTTTGVNGRNPVRATTAELTELAAAGGQLGIKTENIVEFTETMAQMQSATNLGGEAGAKALARFMNVANVSQDQVKNLGSAVVDLGNNFATSEAEIVDMALDMGSTGATVGISAQAVLGYATALSSMGIEAAAGGSALQRIWMDMQNAVSSGGEELEAFAKLSGKSADEFKKSWGKDADGAFRDFLKGLNESEDQVGVLNELGFNNVRDQRALLALAGEKGFGVLTEAIERSNKAWSENTALQKEADAMTQTTAGQMEIAKQNITEAARSFGEVLLPTVVDVSQGVANFAQGLAGMSDEEKKAVVNTGAVIVGLGAAAKVTSKAVKWVGKATEAFGKFAGTGAGQAVGEGLGTFAPFAGMSAGVGLAVTSPFMAYYGVLKWLQKGFVDAREETLSFGESTEDLKANFDEVPAKVKKATDEIAEMEKINEKNLSKKKQAEGMTDGINGMAKAYQNILDAVGNDKGKAISDLFEKNKGLIQSYKDLVGKDLTADSLLDGTAIKNIASLTEEWGAAIDSNNAGIDKAKEGLKNVAKLVTEQAFDSNGYKNIFDAFQDGDKGINSVLSSMKQWGTKFNLPMEYTRDEMGRVMEQAALLKNGFTDMSEAIASTDTNAVNAVFKDFAEFGKTQGFSASQISEMATALNMIPEGKHIEITVDGDMSVVDNVTEVVTEMDGKKCTVSINSEGNIEILDEATGKIQTLQGVGVVSLMVEADGSVAMLDEAGEKVGDLAKNGNVTVTVNADGDVSVLDNITGKIQTLKDMGVVDLRLNLDTGNIEGLDENGNIVVTVNYQTGEIEKPEIPDGEGNANYKTGKIEEPNIPDIEVPIKPTWGAGGSSSKNLADLLKEGNGPVNVPVDVQIEPKFTISGGTGAAESDSSKGFWGKIEEWISNLNWGTSAEAAEIEYDPNVDVQPNKVDTTGITEGIESAEITADVTIKPGTINVEALSSAVSTATQIISSVGTNPINGNSVDITTNVNIKPGTINVEALSSAVSTATQLISAVGTNPINGNSVDITTSVNITAGTINVEALTGAVSSAMQIVSSFGTQPVNITASVNIKAGTINVAELTGAVSTAMQIVSTATTNNINATANVTVTAGMVDTSAISAAIASSVANIADASAAVNVTLTGTITYTADYGGIGSAPELASAVIYSADFGGIGAAPELSGIVHYSADFSGIGSAPTLTGTVVYTAKFSKQATGTDYFGGGLAMVNDQRGVSDPRELVVDHGRAFIPEGRDVVLPLSKGAKVYTASQTKAIMAGIGIPHYAEGKENSDAFTAAKDSWTHYTKIHAVTTSEELEKWVELSKEFVDNEKDAADIAEEIYSLQREINEELNDRSAAWIDDRAALNDWEEYGDTAIAAFDRVRARNLEEFEAGRLTWEEYTDIISDLGSDMYNAQIEQSKNWLEHEEKYRGMSEDDYIAGLDRMAAYTQEYYDRGIINHREYIETMAELDDDYIDKWKDKLDRQMDESLAWIDDRTYFNDWEGYGDDPLAAYERIRERNAAALNEGKLTWEEYTDMMSEAGSALYEGRLDNSREWLDEQRKYFGMETDDYIDGLNRMKAYTQEYYDKGIITYREYAEGMKDINHDIWDAAAEAYDDMLDTQSEYIRELEKKFSDQESELRASWEVEDRAVDMADLEHQLAIFEGAVTDRGQEHYKDLLEQYKDAQREEELYQLEVRNNAVIEDLQAEYDELENAKVDFIKGIAENTDIDVGGYVREITTNISRSSDNTLRTLQEIITAIKSLDFKMEQQNFSDNRTVTIYSADRYDVEYMAGLRG